MPSFLYLENGGYEKEMPISIIWISLGVILFVWAIGTSMGAIDGLFAKISWIVLGAITVIVIGLSVAVYQGGEEISTSEKIVLADISNCYVRHNRAGMSWVTFRVSEADESHSQRNLYYDIDIQASLGYTDELLEHVKINTEDDSMYLIRTRNYKKLGIFEMNHLDSMNVFKTKTDTIYLPEELYHRVPGLEDVNP